MSLYGPVLVTGKIITSTPRHRIRQKCPACKKRITGIKAGITSLFSHPLQNVYFEANMQPNLKVKPSGDTRTGFQLVYPTDIDR